MGNMLLSLVRIVFWILIWTGDRLLVPEVGLVVMVSVRSVRSKVWVIVCLILSVLMFVDLLVILAILVSVKWTEFIFFLDIITYVCCRYWRTSLFIACRIGCHIRARDVVGCWHPVWYSFLWFWYGS